MGNCLLSSPCPAPLHDLEDKLREILDRYLSEGDYILLTQVDKKNKDKDNNKDKNKDKDKDKDKDKRQKYHGPYDDPYAGSQPGVTDPRVEEEGQQDQPRMLQRRELEDDLTDLLRSGYGDLLDQLQTRVDGVFDHFRRQQLLLRS